MQLQKNPQGGDKKPFIHFSLVFSISFIKEPNEVAKEEKKTKQKRPPDQN